MSNKKTYSVPVVRIGYGFKNIEVEANSQEEAEQLALDEAGDHEYSEKESQYEIEDSPRPKTSGELTAINRDYRLLVLNSYQSTLKDLIEAYIEFVQSQNTSDAHIDVETDGFIDLKRSILFSEPLGNEDGNLMECIDSFNTNGEIVTVRAEGDVDEVKLDEINNEQLIEIIAEMEYYIQHPDEIEIR